MLQQHYHQTLADNSISTNREARHQRVSPPPAADIEVNAIGLESPDIFRAIDRLEEKILSSPRVPLTGKTMVDEETLLEQLDAIRLSLPDVVTTAQEILEYKHQIIKEAQQQVQQILAEANQRAYQVTNELGIIDRSEQEATQIRQMVIAECEQLKHQTLLEVEQSRASHLQELERMRQQMSTECQQVQAGADEYADRVLHNMEYQLKDILQTIQLGRQRLNQDAELLQIVPSSELEVTKLSERLKEIGDGHRTGTRELRYPEDVAI